MAWRHTGHPHDPYADAPCLLFQLCDEFTFCSHGRFPFRYSYATLSERPVLADRCAASMMAMTRLPS